MGINPPTKRNPAEEYLARGLPVGSHDDHVAIKGSRPVVFA